MKKIIQTTFLSCSLLMSHNIIAEEPNIKNNSFIADSSYALSDKVVSEDNNKLEGNRITEVFEQDISRDIKLGAFEKATTLSRENIYQMKDEYIKVPNVEQVLFHTTLNSYKPFKITVQFKDMNAKEKSNLIKSLDYSLKEKYNNANYRKAVNGITELSLNNGKITVITTEKKIYSSYTKEEGIIYNVSIIYDIENKYKEAFEKYL